MSTETIIKAHDVRKSFGSTHALRGASLAVNSGEVLAIMGPSGSGKSTLLHCLASIEVADSGSVMYDNKNICKLDDNARTKLRRTDFGFVFQFSQLVPELTALDNIALPLLMNNVGRADAYQQAAEWLNQVGLHKRANNVPGELSGGEAQRVAIARAMITNPKILFADEPTGSLDSLNSERVMELFINSAKSQGTTVIMVTHEPTIAAYADREVFVHDGQITGDK